MAKTYLRNRNTAARTVEGQAFVITPDHTELHTLNETATVIWELAAHGVTIAGAAAALCEDFEVDNTRATTDAQICIDDMLKRELLVEAPQAEDL